MRIEDKFNYDYITFWKPDRSKYLSGYQLSKNIINIAKKKGLMDSLIELNGLSKQKSSKPGEYSRFAYDLNPQPIIKYSNFIVAVPVEYKDIYQNKPEGEASLPECDASIDQGKHDDKMISYLEPSLRDFQITSNCILSNAKLLLMNEDMISRFSNDYKLTADEIRKLTMHKKKLNHYYLDRISLHFNLKKMDGSRTDLIASVSTTPYFEQHILISSTTCRIDIQYLIHQYQKNKHKIKSFNNSLFRYKTTDFLFNPHFDMKQSNIEKIINCIKESYNPSSHLSNDTNIELLALLLKELKPGAILAQNSPDACSIENHLHYHFIIESSQFLFPIFKKNKPRLIYNYQYNINQTIAVYRIEDYPGTIYKIASSDNDLLFVIFIKYLIDNFISSELNKHTTLTIIARFAATNMYEYYIILRKDYRFYKDIKNAVMTYPIANEPTSLSKIQYSRMIGWVEYAGYMMFSNKCVAMQFDDKFFCDILNLHNVDESQCSLFENLIKPALKHLENNILAVNPSSTQLSFDNNLIEEKYSYKRQHKRAQSLSIG